MSAYYNEHDKFAAEWLRQLIKAGHNQALLSGPIATGSPASTEKAGQLNPAHSRWLMGLPTAWDDFAAMVTPLSRRSPKASSKRT